MKCARCSVERYCDGRCQREHWRVHKAICESSAAASLTATLVGLGIPEATLSKCGLLSIVRGHLIFSRTAAELDAPARRKGGQTLLASNQGHGDCPHKWHPTLRDLLTQPDCPGYLYQDMSIATVVCREVPAAGGEPCGGAAAFERMCSGGFYLGSGKGQNHCRRCPGAGKCVGDARAKHCRKCGEHYMGTYGNKCPTCYPDAPEFTMMDWNFPGGRKYGASPDSNSDDEEDETSQKVTWRY